MTDRELLELAAKAAGIDAQFEPWSKTGMVLAKPRGFEIYWNPLTDDGDALRLAVCLNIPVFPYDNETSTGTVGVVAQNFGSKGANTRRAIVRAAAELGQEQT